ncbi:Na(+)-translocating NADH-quinone reductase subunit F [Thiorhodovibrio winogradskyi]|uniref:Na(+)-translocating NADH-quinone reductase subunit F n=1 Tax=Thiorhodovibrio winogradskyi TaxID=77007 RepID=A0ABZ0S5V4_9GAMM|nr:ASKHA domain-containing protein [Thiorhodovibrio winogradskyi]
MSSLIVRTTGQTHRLDCEPGQSLLAGLLAAEIPLRVGCNGSGGCGLCLVRVIAGRADAPTPVEALHLEEPQLAAGVRLACQIVPRGDLELEILALAARPTLQYEPPDQAGLPTRTLATSWSASAAGKLGLAVDLGTSTLSLALFDLGTGEWRGGCRGANPQGLFGQDILTRLTMAVDSPARACQMRQSVIAAIGTGLHGLGRRAAARRENIAAVTLVANPAMLALVTGDRIARLLDPVSWWQPVDWSLDEPRDWAQAWGIDPASRINLVPPLSGLIGSDLLAGLIATNLTVDSGPGLLIDFGTNSEIALWDGMSLWVSSAAGGPAFEANGLRCGLPAEPGAIDRLVFRDGLPEWRVIGGGPPRGFCGTGLVDLIAGLRQADWLSERGHLTPEWSASGFALAAAGDVPRLSGADVDRFQTAKAAIGCGIALLLDRTGLAVADLQRIAVGGTFGQGLDIANASAIGLLPAVAPERIALCGNTALAGAAALLLSPERLEHLSALRAAAQVMNLALEPEFEATFLDHLYLRPLGPGARGDDPT